jgi:hypothetical protein
MFDIFIPKPYVGYKDAWAAAYLSLYGPMDQDEGISEQRRRQEEEQKEMVRGAIRARKNVNSLSKAPRERQSLSAQVSASELYKQLEQAHEMGEKQWIDPIAYLFSGPSIDPLAYLLSGPSSDDHDERKKKTRELLLQNLFDERIFGYVMATTITKIEPGGVWLASWNRSSIETGEINFGLLPTQAPIAWNFIFHSHELMAAFPPMPTIKSSSQADGPLGPRLARWYLEEFDCDHKAAGHTLATLQDAAETKFGKRSSETALRNAIKDAKAIRLKAQPIDG